MERNHWSSWTRKTLSEPNTEMSDWIHSDERMKLRQEVFRALTSYLDQHCRHVYEFCNIWTTQEESSDKSIEDAFQDYLLQNLEKSYAKTN